jgi:hypothetical protein
MQDAGYAPRCVVSSAVQMMSQLLTPLRGSFNKVDGPEFSFAGQSTPEFLNSKGFANDVVKNDPTYMPKVPHDHAANDWRDVISQKIDVPTDILVAI